MDASEVSEPPERVCGAVVALAWAGTSGDERKNSASEHPGMPDVQCLHLTGGSECVIVIDVGLRCDLLPLSR